MSLMRSPQQMEPKCSSQPDLSKIDAVQPLPVMTTRKRKQPDPTCDCKHEIKELRTELTRMTALLEKLVVSQDQTLSTMRDSISEMSLEIKDIKASTSTLVHDQNTIKNSMAELDAKFSTHEEKIVFLESSLSTLKRPSTSEQSGPSTSEDTIREVQERFNRAKNIIIAGIPEQQTYSEDTNSNNDEQEVISLLSAIVADCPKPSKVFRIGKQAADRCRMIKVCFGNQETVMTLLRNKSKCPNKVKMFSDQTPLQQKFLSDLKDELARRKDDGEQDLKIKYVKGTPTIVCDAPKNYQQKTDTKATPPLK